MSADQAARHVLQAYRAAPPDAPLAALGNHAGFSGARLWRVRAAGGDLCLRAWPEAGPRPARLEAIHRLMRHAREAGLAFVPAVLRTPRDRTWVEHAGRLWDLTTWLPGLADFHARPTHARLEAACTALARLHEVWARVEGGRAPCPAVARRLECVRQWQALTQSGWCPPFHPADPDPVRPWAEKAWHLAPRLTARLPEQLALWLAQPVPVQPCLCDVWHDHVLFDGDRVSSLVDYGSVKRDHVAVDLARLLGSLVGDDPAAQAVGIEAYRRVRPLSADEAALVQVLDESATVLGAVNWLRWLYHEARRYEDRSAVARRLAGLVCRMERLAACGPGGAGPHAQDG